MVAISIDIAGALPQQLNGRRLLYTGDSQRKRGRAILRRLSSVTEASSAECGVLRAPPWRSGKVTVRNAPPRGDIHSTETDSLTS